MPRCALLLVVAAGCDSPTPDDPAAVLDAPRFDATPADATPLDGSQPPSACATSEAVTIELPWAGTPAISRGVASLWSHHHYVHHWSAFDANPSVFGSEIWWPACLPGADTVLCATSSPLATYPLPANDAIADGWPLAGTLADGVLVDASHVITRVRDGVLVPTDLVLPAEPTTQYDLDADFIPPFGALDGDILVWRTSEDSIMRTDLVAGTHSTLGMSVDHRGLATAAGTIAWLDGTSVHIVGNATVQIPGATSLAVRADGSVFVSAGPDLVQIGGTVTSLGAPVMHLVADGCDLWAVVQTGADAYELRRVAP